MILMMQNSSSGNTNTSLPLKHRQKILNSEVQDFSDLIYLLRIETNFSVKILKAVGGTILDFIKNNQKWEWILVL